MFTYSILLIATIALPLTAAYIVKLKEYLKKWKTIVLASSITAIPFLLWDSLFTQENIWGFSDAHIVHIKFFNLPIEEFLFFVIIPFSSFIFYFLAKQKKIYIKNVQVYLIFTIILSIFFGFIYIDKINSFYVSISVIISTIFALTLTQRQQSYLVYSFFISIIPFLMVNGVLTSYIVWYNPATKSELMIGTIPFEDLLYSWSLLACNVSVFRWISFYHSRSQEHL